LVQAYQDALFWCISINMHTFGAYLDAVVVVDCPILRRRAPVLSA
jgi:hypothetical protein